MMRFWPFASRSAPLAPGAFGFDIAALAPQLGGVLAVEQVRAEGHVVAFGGHLLVPPSSALSELLPRFRPFGYTPFLETSEGLTWVRALPFVEVDVPSRPAINLGLFVLTVVATFLAGALPLGAIPFVNWNPLTEGMNVLSGAQFAGTLLAILGTHEFGHYFTARAYGASVSLPFFIPAPPPFLFGTLGAVIRMRSPARDRNSLFDIAAAGPLAGLVIALPALWIGLGWSKVGALPEGAAVVFGDSLLMRGLTWLRFGQLPPGHDVFVHPVALAAWVGLFVTALNLIPVGQLDGGRIAYALFGAWHRQVSVATFLGLLALGAVTGSANWFVWAFLLFFVLGFRHQPPLDDLSPLSSGRYAVGVLCLVLLVLLIPPVPVAIQ
ncbi:MAG TPA: site-2 protease family protein [Candidatus Bathyarchaeia archaeon]|nr:site-2 protease family protein [Candidatus Bathyarchaeia archaeon]